MIKVVRKATPRYHAFTLRQEVSLGRGEDVMYGEPGDVLLIDTIQGTMHIEKESHVKEYYEEVKDGR